MREGRQQRPRSRPPQARGGASSTEYLVVFVAQQIREDSQHGACHLGTHVLPLRKQNQTRHDESKLRSTAASQADRIQVLAPVLMGRVALGASLNQPAPQRPPLGRRGDCSHLPKGCCGVQRLGPGRHPPVRRSGAGGGGLSLLRQAQSYSPVRAPAVTEPRCPSSGHGYRARNHRQLELPNGTLTVTASAVMTAREADYNLMDTLKLGLHSG